jgi:hypothetical protein
MVHAHIIDNEGRGILPQTKGENMKPKIEACKECGRTIKYSKSGFCHFCTSKGKRSWKYKHGKTCKDAKPRYCECGKQIINYKSKVCNDCRGLPCRGTKSHSWLGDKVSINGLHKWVRKYLPKPEFCEECGMKPPFDLANKGVYDRDFNNWEWLCRRCHMKKDGRLETLKKTQFQKK